MTYAYYDYPDEMEELRRMEHRKYVKQCEMLCDIKPDCICTGGSGSITLQSPELWRKLSLPTLKEICRIAKQAGVLTMVHSCGKERCFVEAAANETDLNCINPLEIPPMGDCDLAELKRSFGKKISLMGNLHTTEVMLKGTPDDVERAAKKAIDDAADGRRLHPLHRRPVRPRHPRREHLQDGRGGEDVRGIPVIAGRS